MPFWITPKFKMLVLIVIAMIATSLIYYPILAIAKKKDLVDNPDARKLQKIPVPVLGGIAVFFGIVFSLCYFKTTISHTTLFPVIGIMTIMLYFGSIDDILDLPAKLRVIVETLAAMLLIYGDRYAIMNFQGILGIDILSPYVAVPLTVVAFVGIINAVNMIDGVDGLLSGFGIVSCSLLATMCFLVHDYSFAALGFITAGSLVPFLLHNVFGQKSKMFMGDGGSMMIGTVLSAMVFALLRLRLPYTEFVDKGVSLVPFCLAVLSLPVFDTIRLIIERVSSGRSPFSADKCHLHHLFLEFGISHGMTVFMEIILLLFVVSCWGISCLLGAGSNIQLAVVLVSSMLISFGCAYLLRRQIKTQGVLYRLLTRLANKSSLRNQNKSRITELIDKFS